MTNRLLNTFGFRIASEDAYYEFLRSVMRPIPLFVQPAFFRAAHNAWNTHARYGQHGRTCLWCGMVDGDALLHYLTCPVMLHAMRRICPLLQGLWCHWPHPPLLPRLSPAAFCIHVSSLAWSRLIVVWHDFLVHCHALAKYSVLRPEWWPQAFTARRRVWSRYSPSTSRLLDQFLQRWPNTYQPS